jgi:hypothetical protein
MEKVGVVMTRTDRMGEVLYVPPGGVLHVFERSVEPAGLLTGTGKYVCLHVGTGMRVHFRANEFGPENPRAQRILAAYTDVEVKFVGSVVFDGMPGDRIYEIIQSI